MADFNYEQPQSRRQRQRQPQRRPSQTCDPNEEDLYSPEPLERAPSNNRTVQSQPQSQRSGKNVIKRRPVNPIISESPIVVDTSYDSLLSPIIPSPLRIRKPKVQAPRSPPSAMRPVRLLIASLGNPPPYHSTRHSAGHILLKHIATQLGLPSLTKSKVFGSGSASLGADVGRPEFTLWQSGSMMNVSGAGTLKAWKQFNNLNPSSSDVITALVVLHDELESSLGTIKLRRGESSPKGHNGIKSVQSSLKSADSLQSLGDRFIKIGIGIGRPQSREKDDVSAWVLGQLTHAEQGKIEAATASALAVIGNEIGRLEGL